jgi:DNA-binding beta-propeller fold protein YncE
MGKVGDRGGCGRWKWLTLALLSVVVVMAGDVAVATAAGGGLTFANCVGRAEPSPTAAGCTLVAGYPLIEPTAVAVSPDGKQLYVASADSGEGDVSHFTLNSSGKPTFVSCVGNIMGCTATNPAGALGGAVDMVVSPDGKQLYVASGHLGNNVSYLSLDSSGNPTFVGCIGDFTGCTPTAPSGALDFAFGVAVTPDGKQLYASGHSGNDVSHMTLNALGVPTFVGCVGDLSGCTATTPAAALDSVEGLAVSPDGKQLYAVTSTGDVSHLTLDSSGKPTFSDCVGVSSGCTATNPQLLLGLGTRVVVSPDSKQLYAVSANGVTHLTLGSSGAMTFASCVGGVSPCTAPSISGALADLDAVAVSPDGKQLYTGQASNGSGNVSHLTLDSSGTPKFASCVGVTPAGCTHTSSGTLEYVDGVTLSPDGKHLYAAGVTFGDLDNFTVTPSASIPPPNTTLTSVVIVKGHRKATFDFKGSGGVGALHFQCKLDSGGWQTCASPKTYTGLAHGSHTFQVRAIDSRGRADPTPAKHSFTI